MPRDTYCMAELRMAIVQTFAELWRKHGRTLPVLEVYRMVSLSPAPSFFLTEKEASRIIWRFSNVGFKERRRELVQQRDRDFIDTYCRLRLANNLMSKNDLVMLALQQPAPRYYISHYMVAGIISQYGKNNKRCTKH